MLLRRGILFCSRIVEGHGGVQEPPGPLSPFLCGVVSNSPTSGTERIRIRGCHSPLQERLDLKRIACGQVRGLLRESVPQVREVQGVSRQRERESQMDEPARLGLCEAA